LDKKPDGAREREGNEKVPLSSWVDEMSRYFYKAKGLNLGRPWMVGGNRRGEGLKRKGRKRNSRN
jgi:hypothetical protein